MTDYTLRTPSQRYDRYTAQMQRLKTLLDLLRRYRALLMAVGVIILAAAVCFLFAVGCFTGEATCGDFLYGESPDCGLKAFMSEVHYQYATTGTEAVWHDAMPTEPGTYRIRAVSKNAFGGERFSEEMTAKLLPRTLTVRVSDAGYVYGDFSEALAAEHTVAEGLIPGDRLANVKYTVQGSEQMGYQVDIAQLQVLNASGADVTACYIPKTEGGSFTMEPRPVTITADSHEKVYDAMVWDAATAKITNGTLGFDDRLSISFGGFPTKAGSYPIEPLCRILDAEGNDISFCYDMTLIAGTLKIMPRPITVATGSAEKVYDEKPLTNSEWSILSGEPVPGHTLSGNTTGSRTDQGSSENTITLKMTDENGNDVTDNYSFTVEAGTLTIHPIVLRFGSDSYDRVYDGEAMWGGKGWHISGNVLSGHYFSYSSNVWPEDAGTYQNTMDVFVYNSAGEDVTARGYKIEVECGTLIIRKRPVTITSGSAEKLYDGTPLMCGDWKITAGTMPNNYTGEDVRTTNFTGKQTEVGSSPNYFTVRMTNRLGEDTTHNYQITYEYGTLTVLENPNPPQQNGGNTGSGNSGNPGGTAGAGLGDPTKGAMVGFPGEPSDEVFAVVKHVKGLSDASPFYFRYTSYGDYTGSGWAAPVDCRGSFVSPLAYVGYSLEAAGRRSISMTIQRVNGCPVLSPYHLLNFSFYLPFCDSYVKNGDLTYDVTCYAEDSYKKLAGMKVVKEQTQHEAGYRHFVYANYLQIPVSTKQLLRDWADSAGISAGSPTLVEDIQRAVQNAAVYNLHGKDYPAGVDVAVYFLTEAKEGVCQHFATAATMLYRAFGIPARYTVGFAKTVTPNGETQLTAGDAHSWVEVYVDGLGWVPIDATPSSTSQLPQQNKVELHLLPYSATKYYDGKNFEEYDLEQYAIVKGQLKEGHRLAVTYRTNQYTAAPGTYLNMILSCRVYDRQGKDVSDQYSFTCFAGELKILKRQITVATGSATKPFDGTPLCCGDYWIAAGSLAPNERLIVTLDNSITHPGTTQNTAAEYRIEREVRPGVWETVTDCYDISWLCGYLEISEPSDH